MSVYYLILILILIPAYPLCIKKPTKRKKTVYTLIVFSAFFLIVGLRYGTGESYFADYDFFTEISRSSLGGVFGHNTEPGFVLLTLLISYVSESFVFANLVYSAAVFIPAAVIIRRYSDNIWLSCLIYFCASLFIASMNFTRQSIAVSILMTAYGFIKNKEHIPVIFITIIAALFHVSALLFLPVYLISTVKPAKYFYIALGLFCVELFVLFEPFISSVTNYMSERKGEDYSVYAMSIDNAVFSPFYLIMPAVLCILTIISYFFGWRKRNEPALFHVICSAACLFTWALSIRTVYAERFTYYFMIFSVLGIPSAVDYFIGDFSELVLVADSVGNSIKQKLFKQGENYRRLYMRGGKTKFYAIFGLFLVFCLVYNGFNLAVYSHCNNRSFYKSAINQIEYMRYSFSSNKIKQLKSETDMRDYLIKLKYPDFSYIITVKPDENLTVSKTLSDALAFIGVTGEVLSGKNFGKCFVAVGERGNMVYKNYDSSDIAYYSAKLCGYSIDIYSKSGYSGAEINGINYSLDTMGVNIVVFEDKTGVLIDRISYTMSDGQPVIMRTALVTE